VKSTISEPSSWQRVISVEVPESELNTVVVEKESQYRKDIRLPGFRKGKVPSGMVKGRFGKAIRTEAIEDMVQKGYESACKENKLNPICEARVKEIKADEGSPLRFTIETEVDPTIEVKGYDKLKIRAEPKKIKSGQVDEALEGLRDRLAELRDVDRSAKSGDLLTIEYVTVSIDGVPRTNFKNPTYPIELGGGKIKDFDKGLQGHSAGETVDIRVKFPKDYGEAGVAGKVGEFTIAIKKVQEKILPQVNEEFLKKLGDFKDEEALREHILKDLEQREKERAKNEAYNEAIEKLIKQNPFEVPQSRVERYIDYMMEEAARYNQGGPAPKREEVAEKYRDAGVKIIKRYRIIDYIATKESIKATQEEVDERVKQMAQMYNQQFEELKESLRKNGTTNRIRSDIREQKTLDFLIRE
jgi:trigger factor